jgi:pyrimidine deaminase RibD-like protein
VGAVIVDRAGGELARGSSRETDPYLHAEEVALANLAIDADLRSATIYSSLEPCSRRNSRPRACAQLILVSGIRRVVLGMREPPLFVRCEGVALLRQGGVEVLEVPELADQVRAINANLFDPERIGQRTP